MSSDPYAIPRRVDSLAECAFYHTMDLPEVGLVHGVFDFRDRVDYFMRDVDFSGKRVLEVGPASGFFTFSMEARGADVVVVETSEAFTWDAVPYDLPLLETWGAELLPHMEKLRNSFWFAHRCMGSRARVHYGSGYRIPPGLGRFDISTLSCVLLHNGDPLAMIRNCAGVTDDILIITDVYDEELVATGLPVMKLAPRMDKRLPFTWWHISPDVVREFAAILGFEEIGFEVHVETFTPEATGVPEPQPQYTLVLERRRPWDPVPAQVRTRE